ncbi:hypothetical protein [[Mycobacterium] burgundiense]|uniref:MFS transporter n=1 Tax=[Mycobacterium] burgundiense TaxID=3064286 RepID=A0ABN9MWY0_9MYCO|nr:hypothetical protein [Mycolicibacterium sp. MU0053]CAJ1496462.1 hypothetical protein MU0053_000659 [Mycolicibacterium sp. MU0053]
MLGIGLLADRAGLNAALYGFSAAAGVMAATMLAVLVIRQRIVSKRR